MAKSSTRGAKFFATGGGYATSDEFFKSLEIHVWEAAIKALEDKKVGSSLLKKIKEEGQAILTLGKPTSDLIYPELGALLFWYTN